MPKGSRIIEVNHHLLEYKRKAREKLMSEQGLEHRSKRPIEPKAAFGQMKFNMAYRRLRHFGIEKVTMDFAFFAIVFNIKKMCVNMAKMLSELKNMAANGLYPSKNHVLLSIRRIENLNLPKIAA